MNALIHQYSCSSSMDSCTHINHLPSASPPPSPSPSSSCSNIHDRNECCKARRNLNTELKLALTISPSFTNKHNFSSYAPTQRKVERFDWPPIKCIFRRRVVTEVIKEEKNEVDDASSSLFVKVYMEGIPIGRKLDLLKYHGYDSLLQTLSHMFKAIILHPDGERDDHPPHQYHFLTYEDKDGDWMMVGDVPWEMFLSNVKRLQITRADRC